MQWIVARNPLNRTDSTHPRRDTPRSGTLYIAVMGTAIIVSVMAFSALALARLHLRDAQESNDWYEARLAALSGVENAVTRINADEDWRTNFQNNVEYPATPVSMGSGTFTWKLVDEDGDLADDESDPVTIYGIGRAGASTSVESVTGQSSEPGVYLLEGSWTPVPAP